MHWLCPFFDLPVFSRDEQHPCRTLYMNDRSAAQQLSISIAAVERDTGLSKDTLRVWERRYGFPQPTRDAFGERLYPMEQVDKLRLLRRLIDSGHRPGRVVSLSVEDLQQLAEASPSGLRSETVESLAAHDELSAMLDLIKQQRIEEFRRELSNLAMRLGLQRFLVEVVAPLTERVGDAWARGYFEIFEEHLFTESVQIVLRGIIATIPQPGTRPRVLLTTFPQESHGLGLLMAESLLAMEGARCMSLGTQTPVWDIVLAAASQRVDVVALSFSQAMNPNQAIDGLVELRAKLPSRVEIWAGGSCPALSRRCPAGVQLVLGLDAVSQHVQRWRREHAE